MESKRRTQCHWCGSTEQADLVYTKRWGWQCRSAKACNARRAAEATR